MQDVMQALYLTRNARGLPASARRYSETPQELAVGILAQLLLVKNGKESRG